MPGAVQPKKFTLRQYKNGSWKTIEDVISIEVPITIFWSLDGQDEQRATLWTWPDFLEEVASGHVLLEKLPDFYGKVAAELVAQGNDNDLLVRVTLQSVPPTGCPKKSLSTMQAADLLRAMDDFIGEEGLWDGTGCFHKAGVYCAKEQKLLHKVEDIARHNCIDRLAGWAALQNVSLDDKVLLVSARLTRSLCAKALRAGFKFLVSRSAVTTAAVSMAQDAGATLVGFARTREGRFTLFTDPQGLLR